MQAFFNGVTEGIILAYVDITAVVFRRAISMLKRATIQDMREVLQSDVSDRTLNEQLSLSSHNGGIPSQLEYRKLSSLLPFLNCKESALENCMHLIKGETDLNNIMVEGEDCRFP